MSKETNSQPKACEVGPVFSAGADAIAFFAAIKKLNPNARVLERGTYLRVLVPEKCILTKAAIEGELGESLSWPEDLEMIMPAFKGRLQISDDKAIWSAFQEVNHA